MGLIGIKIRIARKEKVVLEFEHNKKKPLKTEIDDEETKEKIMAITAENLQEVAKEIFREEQLSTIIYEPKDL